jgi:hypothetical protein
VRTRDLVRLFIYSPGSPMCSLDSCAFGHCEINWLWHGGRCVCKRGPDFSSLEMLIASIFAFRNLDQINGKNIHSGYISVKQLSGDLIVGVVLVRLAMKSDPAAVVSYVRDMTRYALNAAAAEYQTRGDVRGATDRADKAARYEHLEYHLLRESVRKKNVTSLIRDLNNLRTNIGASSPVQCNNEAEVNALLNVACGGTRGSELLGMSTSGPAMRDWVDIHLSVAASAGSSRSSCRRASAAAS